MNKTTLIKAAINATKACHVPYSKFKVGAAILMKDGTIIEGANIENSSYGLSMCAERTALYHAHLKGYRKQDMVAMAVIGPTDGPISPCGACRQVMHELMNSKTPIYLSNLKQDIKETTPEALLPYAFTAEDLK
ncbi:MAG: cytidine deaminase [Bacilli bacterium]